MPAVVRILVFAPIRHRYVPIPMKTVERVGGFGADTWTGVREPYLADLHFMK